GTELSRGTGLRGEARIALQLPGRPGLRRRLRGAGLLRRVPRLPLPRGASVRGRPARRLPTETWRGRLRGALRPEVKEPKRTSPDPGARPGSPAPARGATGPCRSRRPRYATSAAFAIAA